MVEKGLNQFFENYLTKEPLFLDKKTLQSNYYPPSLSHRDSQIQQIANILAPALRVERPSNLFVYGSTGTGKTVSVQHITTQIQAVANKNNIPIKIVYINCKLKNIADTEYRLMAQLCREFGKDIPSTGLPTNDVQRFFFSSIDKQHQIVILILDEIDQLIKKAGDEVLYNLTRNNSDMQNAQVAIIGISNDLKFVDNLDPRVKSSLSEEEILFPHYNAIQIQDILKERSSKAFKPNVLEEGLIEKCAAYAAREHGDARRALELLRVAGEIAERAQENKVAIKHLDLAEEKIEHDRLLDIISTQPKQFQAVLYAALNLKETKGAFTGDVYNLYKNICQQTKLRPLTQRRIGDIIAEFDMLGLITANVISKGRYGRTREISIAIPSGTEPKVKETLKKELGLS
ncbi:ORC1-type DNA replication protein [Candidatus Woesearchaeota archaeon]|nr:ORC1-type DNA replication protein [Candidatus Woesearchaeota archaeon]